MSRQYGDLREWKAAVESVGLVVQEHWHLNTETGEKERHDGFYAHRPNGTIGAIWQNCRDHGWVHDLPAGLILASDFHFDKHAYDRLNRRPVEKLIIP